MARDSMKDDVSIKTEAEMEIMGEGGKKLARVKKALGKAVKVGVSAIEIEKLAVKLIEEEGAEASFKKVPGYSWATCVNVNDGVVHGIPKKETIFKEGDVISVDVGVFYKGYHTDTALTVYLGEDQEVKDFVEAGRKAMWDGVHAVKRGATIADISKSIEKRLIMNEITPVWSLTGHGVGKELHEAPYIPCFVSDDPSQKIRIKEGFVLAVEVMFTRGNGQIRLEKDGWTIRTKDGKISALFEETVMVTKSGPKVITA